MTVEQYNEISSLCNRVLHERARNNWIVYEFLDDLRHDVIVNIINMDVISKWDPSKAMFSTFIDACINNCISTLLKNKMSYLNREGMYYAEMSTTISVNDMADISDNEILDIVASNSPLVDSGDLETFIIDKVFLEQVLETVSDKRKDMVVKVLNGYTVKEIAKEYDVSVQAVYQNIRNFVALAKELSK